MMRLAGLLAIVVLVAAACRAPGEPPAHPAQGEYQDVIGRELDSAGSALATSELVLRYVEAGRLPGTYASVSLRQAANDLRKVAQDLGEIHPPRRAARAQAQFLAICRRDGEALAVMHRHLGDRRQRARVRAAVARDSKLLDEKLGKQLDPA